MYLLYTSLYSNIALIPIIASIFPKTAIFLDFPILIFIIPGSIENIPEAAHLWF